MSETGKLTPVEKSFEELRAALEAPDVPAGLQKKVAPDLEEIAKILAKARKGS